MPHWKIEGYEGQEQIFNMTVPTGCFSEKRIKELLQVLAAKQGLTPDEIVGAYANKKCSRSNNLLAVSRDGIHPSFTCGLNPYFTARVVHENL